MAELRGRVREKLRQQLLEHGGSAAMHDPEIFAEVERVLQSATSVGDASALVLPELLGDPDTWRLQTAMRYRSHQIGRAHV